MKVLCKQALDSTLWIPVLIVNQISYPSAEFRIPKPTNFVFHKRKFPGTWITLHGAKQTAINCYITGWLNKVLAATVYLDQPRELRSADLVQGLEGQEAEADSEPPQLSHHLLQKPALTGD